MYAYVLGLTAPLSAIAEFTPLNSTRRWVGTSEANGLCCCNGVAIAASNPWRNAMEDHII